jgi:hypothetical protein
MSVSEIANDLVNLCRQGQFMEAIEKHYGDDIVSVEPVAHPGMPAEMSGIEAIKGKTAWWGENHEVHGLEITGPYVGDEGFTVKFFMDVTNKPSGLRTQMTEVGVYLVRDGKIVREEFYYNAAGGGA